MDIIMLELDIRATLQLERFCELGSQFKVEPTQLQKNKREKNESYVNSLPSSLKATRDKLLVTKSFEH
jgi:hypothetical protein